MTARCPHGEAGSHWYNERTPTAAEIKHARLTDVGSWRKWCAGPPRDPLMFEPWRGKLEWQMNLLPHPIDGVHRIDGKWEAWLDGKIVAAGPTKAIIEAAYEHYKPRTVPTEPETWAVHPQSVLLDLLPEGTDWQVPSELRHERLTTEELHTVQMLHDKFQVQKDVDVEAAREMVARFQKEYGEKWAKVLTLAAAVSAVSQDSLKDFKPLGWAGLGRVVWYDEPIYNALVKEFGYDPLAVRP